MDAYRYWAFISYSHADEHWARWLHSALETYRVPRRLVGQQHADGPIPRRLMPVFRDRDELSTSSELGAAIDRALAESRHLIVICSPNSAASRWVDAEVRRYKSLGREGRVLALIVDGEPGAVDPARECFPPSLREHFDAEGRATGEACEPIAADARAFADHKHGAKLKLIAGLLGVGYDELRQRERRRRLVRRLRNLALVAAFAGSLFGLWSWQQAQQAQREHRRQLDSWIGLGLQALDRGQGARAGAYLSAAYSGGADGSAVRVPLARALSVIEARLPLRLEHGREVSKVRFSPDGRGLLSYGGGHGLRWSLDGDAPGLRLQGGPERIFDLRFAPDGRHALATGIGGGASSRHSQGYYTAIWNLQGGGAPVATVPGLVFPASLRPFDAEGRRLVTVEIVERERGIPQRRVQVWEVASGRRLLTLPGDDRLNNPEFSPDGRRLLTAGEDGAPVRIWDADDGRLLLSLRQRPPIVSTGANFSADGRLVISSAETGALRLWDAASGELVDALGNHRGYAPPVATSADGRRWVTVGADGTRVWDIEQRQLLFETRELAGYTFSARLSGDGRLLLLPDSPLGNQLWNVDLGQRVAILESDGEPVRTADFDASGQHLATADRSGRLRLWSLPALDRQPLAVMAHGPTIDLALLPEVSTAAWAPDGRRIASAGHDGAVRIWDAQGRALQVLQGHEAVVLDLAWASDGQRLVSIGGGGQIRVWSAASGELLLKLDSELKTLERMALSDDGRHLAVIDDGNRVQLWRLEPGSAAVPLARTAEPIRALRFSADGTRLWLADAGSVISVWNAVDGQRFGEIEGQPGGVSSLLRDTPTGRWLSGGPDGQAHLLDAAGRRLATLDGEADAAPAIVTAALAPSASWAALGMADGRISLWSPASGDRRTLVGHARAIESLHFNADASLLASHDEQGHLRLWDVASGRLLQSFGDGDRLAAVEFSPDGRRLLFAEQIGNRVQLLDVAAESRTAAEIAQRIACLVPWQIDREQLRPRAVELVEGCR